MAIHSHWFSTRSPRMGASLSTGAPYGRVADQEQLGSGLALLSANWSRGRVTHAARDQECVRGFEAVVHQVRHVCRFPDSVAEAICRRVGIELRRGQQTRAASSRPVRPVSRGIVEIGRADLISASRRWRTRSSSAHLRRA